MGLTGKSNHRANIFFGRRGFLHFVHCTKPNHPFLSGVFSNKHGLISGFSLSPFGPLKMRP